jgi:hypothetical protein
VPESLQPVAQGPNWTGNDMTLLVRFPVATGHERSIFETFFTVLPSIGDSYVGGFHRGPPDCIARLRGSQVSVLETKSVRPARPEIIRDDRTVPSIQEKMRHANQENKQPHSSGVLKNSRYWTRSFF